MDLTNTLISGLAGTALSLALNYIPGLNTKFAELKSEYKSLVVALSLLIISVLIAGSSCLNLWVYMTCDKSGFMTLVQSFFAALIASQSVYQLSPQTQEVKDIKNK